LPCFLRLGDVEARVAEAEDGTTATDGTHDDTTTADDE